MSHQELHLRCCPNREHQKRGRVTARAERAADHVVVRRSRTVKAGAVVVIGVVGIAVVAIAAAAAAAAAAVVVVAVVFGWMSEVAAS